MYHFDSAFVHSCIPAPPSIFLLLLFLTASVAWIGHHSSASLLHHFVVNRPAALTTPRYQFSLFLAALDHSALFTPNSKTGLCVDPSVALNALISSARDWVQFFSGRPGLGLSPHQPSSRTTRDGSAARLLSFVRLPQGGGGLCGWSSQRSHVVLRVSAVDMWWSVRCRPWKPISFRSRF